MLAGRILIEPAAHAPREPVLEAAMLGHCPGAADHSALSTSTRRRMREAGFGLEVDCLEGLACGLLSSEDQLRIQALQHLPVPLHSHAEFEQVFPEAKTEPSVYASLIAGDRAWLPMAVRDFFSSGGQRLWVVSIPQDEWSQGFLPDIGEGLHQSWGLRGLATVFPLERLGLVALPDLERLRLPANLVDPRGKRLDNPDPAFLPCTQNLDDDHAERRAPADEYPAAMTLLSLLEPITAALEHYRPDLQCLLTLGLSYSPLAGSTVASPTDLAGLKELLATGVQERRARLRRIQFLFPYFKGPDYALKSATGYVSGLQCLSAQTEGIWRSVAGRSLSTDGAPFPPLEQWQVHQLRDEPGISILHEHKRSIRLDDERLTVPALHPHDYKTNSRSHRSAEVTRFMGYLMRELRQLGNSLIFNASADDPSPRLALERFFNQLYQLGALRGKRVEDAYTISRRELADNVIGYDILVAPAYPLDTIRLAFIRAGDAWEVAANG